MENQTITSIKKGSTNASKTIADIQMRMAKHIITQYGYHDNIDIRHILNETKAGAWRKPALLKMLETVFSAS
jgi:hypothetical protein